LEKISRINLIKKKDKKMSLGNLLQNPDASQRKQALAHVNKWEKTGLLEGLR
jgi:hypothetical protein